MTDLLDGTARTFPPIPADDPARSLAVARPDDPDLTRVFVAGGLYTILLKGEDTGGRYSLIDMRVPAGGGPPPHRHDFEEMFTLTEGELEFTFRGETSTVRAGDTVNVPANAPHFLPQRLGPARADAVHVHAARPGGVLPPPRRPGREPLRDPAHPDPGGTGGAREEGPVARPALPLRVREP